MIDKNKSPLICFILKYNNESHCGTVQDLNRKKNSLTNSAPLFLRPEE